MAKLIISPFRTLNEEYLGIKVSEYKISGEILHDGDFIKDYSSDTPLSIKSVFGINCEQVYRELVLPKDAILQLIVRCKCTTTRYTIYKESDPFNGMQAKEISMHLEIPAGKIAEALYVEYSLCVNKPGNGGDEFSPSKVASTIWRTNRKFLLEGFGSMFPTTIENFTEAQGGKKAAWRIDWKKTSLYGSPSKVRLILNGLNTNFIQKINPEEGVEQDKASAQLLYYGVAVSLLEHASRNDNAEKLRNEKFEERTLGSYLINFLTVYLKTNTGDTNIGNILDRYKNDPETVRSILQSNLSKLHD